MKDTFENLPHFNVEDVESGIEKNKEHNKEGVFLEKLINKFDDITRYAKYITAIFAVATGISGHTVETADNGALNRVMQFVRGGVEYAAYKLSESESVKKKQEQVERIFGKHAPDFGILHAWNKTMGNEEKVAQKVNISKEAIQGNNGSITAEKLSSILKMYPRGWVDGEVDSITYSDTEYVRLGVQERGLDSAEWSALATAERGLMKEGSAIRFYPIAKIKTLRSLDNALAHELGHVNDWERDGDIAIEDRLNMLIAVNGRVFAHDRLNSYYVELIKNEDKQLERYLKCTEYWAEICAAYFTTPWGMPFDDFELVDRFVKKSDPDFDESAGSRKRLSVLDASTFSDPQLVDRDVNARSHGPVPVPNTDPLTIEDIDHSSWPELPPSNTSLHDDRN